MKKTLSILLVLAMVLSLGLGLVSASAEDKTKVVVWTFAAEDQEETSTFARLKKWAEDFTAGNDKIEVVVEGSKDAQVLLTALAGNEGPDIFQNYWNNAPAWAEKGALLDLTEYVNNAPESWDKADFLDASWGLCTYNDHIYFIPYTYSSSFIFYDKDVLKEAGYDEFPKTLDEMIELADKLVVIGEGGKIERMGILPDVPWLETVMWPVAFNAPYTSEDGKTITFNDPTMVKAYQWQADIYAKYGYDNVKNFTESFGNDAQDPLFTGKLVMRWRADSAIPNMIKYGKETGTNVGMAFMPAAEDGTAYGMLTCAVWGVNAHTKNVDATIEVLYSLTGKENMQWLANGQFNNGTFMPRVSALNYVIDGEFEDMAKECATMLRDGQFRHFPMSSYIGEYLAAINTQMTEALAGYITVEEGCQNVVDEIQPIADAANAQ